jgi:RimJ/RimL family protein N-acetyltransferase
VRLAPFAEEHREGRRAAADDDRVWEFMHLSGRGPDFDRPFEDVARRAEGNRRPSAVRLLATGEPIGATSSIEPDARHKRVEIGWAWYRPDHWEDRKVRSPKN